MIHGASERLRQQWQSSKLQQWLQAQTPRDRVLLLVMALALVLALIWSMVWQPLQTRLEQAQRSYAQAQADHLWLQQRAELIPGLLQRNAESATGSGQALLTVVSDSARRHEIPLSRFQPDSGGALSLSVDAVSFVELVRWLQALQQDAGVSVRSMTLDGRQAGGEVRARLILQ